MESVIINFANACVQIKELCQKYPDLVIVTCQSDRIVLEGAITVNHRIDSYTLCKTYKVRIIIFPDSDMLPEIYETDGVIKNYQHQYTNGKLCLETDTYIKWYFREEFKLTVWMEKFVIPYFISYEFYVKYDEFPFGDRLHGYLGILQSYQDIFQVKDVVVAWLIIKHIANNRYRGNGLCPCQSGKKLRVCHGRYLLPFYKNRLLYKMLCEDFDCINVMLKEMSKGKSC